MERSTQSLMTKGNIINRSLDESDQMFLATVQMISRSYTLVLIVASFVCNPLTQIVLSRKAFRNNAVSLYLRFLSAIDFIAILLGLGVPFLEHTFHVDVKYAPLACKIVGFFMSAVVACSSWTLVAVGLERVQSILQPHRSGKFCTFCTPKRAIIVTVVVVFAVYSPALFIYGHLEFSDNMNTTLIYHCVSLPDCTALRNIYYALDCSIFVYIPILFLVTFNILIVYGVVRSRQHLQKFKQETGNFRTSSRASSMTTAAFRREASLTKMLLAVNLSFIFCNFPICLSTALFTSSEVAQPAVVSGIFDLFSVFLYTNNSLNFFLYCVTGSKFRQETKLVLWDILTLRCCRRKKLIN